METARWQPATIVAESIRQRKLSPVEAVEDALAGIERLNPVYNAFLTVRSEEARAEAQHAERALMSGSALGPLHGMPVSVKDLLYTAGIRSTGGSLVYKDFVPDFDTPLVTRLREGPRGAFVDSVEVDWGSAVAEFRSFDVAP